MAGSTPIKMKKGDKMESFWGTKKEIIQTAWIVLFLILFFLYIAGEERKETTNIENNGVDGVAIITGFSKDRRGSAYAHYVYKVDSLELSYATRWFKGSKIGAKFRVRYLKANPKEVRFYENEPLK
jgi:hypothetical protein